MMTLEDVTIDLIMAGADRGAVVRDTDVPAVIVLMLRDRAVATLGAALHPVCHELGTEPAPLPDGTILLSTSCTRMSELCDQSPRSWLFFTQRLGQTAITGIIFRGRELCERVAAICNAHLCPCSLDPRRDPDGYTITEIKQR